MIVTDNAVRRIPLVAIAILGSALAGAQSSVDLATGRPATPGITRTALKDDAKTAVTRVQFAPGAAEVPHTHPYDIMLIPVVDGAVEIQIGGTKITPVKSGEVQFVARDVIHSVANKGKSEFTLIAVAVK